MKMQKIILLIFLSWIQTIHFSEAQIPRQFIEISVVPDKFDWTYQLGEYAEFQISITQSGVPIDGQNVRYVVMEEKMLPLKEESLILKNGKAITPKFSMDQPGFLRCEVYATYEGKEYKGIGTAAYQPMDIKPTVKMPGDFETFWNEGKSELAKIPIDPKWIHIPERSNSKVDVYHVSFQNIRNSRIYGILCIPKGGGKYPAILSVPGAGIRPYQGDIAKAERGAITLQIGIHGIPVDMSQEIYSNLGSGALNGYMHFNNNNKELYYYKRVYLGCVRAVDFLVSLPQYDGQNLAVQGGSQGGALAITTAALDSRIKYLAAVYPALSDLTGYLNGRAGGWPHVFTGQNLNYYNKPEVIEALAYYDVVNFARNLKTPGFYTWGFNDEVCPPTSYYSAYNEIKAPMEVFVVKETGHWTFPEQGKKIEDWLFEKLQK
jgi:cephalosporin-C deacetylase